MVPVTHRVQQAFLLTFEGETGSSEKDHQTRPVAVSWRVTALAC